MSETTPHPDPSNFVQMARFDRLMAQRKVHQAYEVLAELQDQCPERFHVPAARGPDGPPEAA